MLLVFIWILLFTFVYLWRLMDVESLFDLTDLNTFLILLLALSCMGIILDLYYRLTNGQNIEEDSMLYSFIYSYTLNLIVYFMAIWAVFFFHYITPYNAYSVLDIYFFNKNYSPSFLLATIVIILSIGTLSSLVSHFVTIRIVNSILASLLLLIVAYVGLLLSIIFYSISSFRSKDQSSWDFNLINPSSSIVFNDKNAALAFDWHLPNINQFFIGWEGLSVSLYLFIFFLTITLILSIVLIVAIVYLYNYSINPNLVLDHIKPILKSLYFISWVLVVVYTISSVYHTFSDLCTYGLDPLY